MKHEGFILNSPRVSGLKSWLVGLGWSSSSKININQIGGFWYVVFSFIKMAVFLNDLRLAVLLQWFVNLKNVFLQGGEVSFKFIIHLLQCSFIKAQSYFLHYFLFIMPFYSCLSHFIHVYAYIWIRNYEMQFISRKNIFNMFMWSVEHAFLYFIIIWLVIL